MTAQGGKSIYGVSVGILMLDARFPRIQGDMGNAATWPFPVLYKIVKGATPDLVVRQGAAGTLDTFISAARELVEMGADGITTNCGFLSLFQKELAQAVSVPVVSSALMQVRQVNALLPDDRRTGILTISQSTLTKAHLDKADVPPDTPIGTTEHGKEFTRVILGNETELDVNAACQDNVEAALDLQKRNPHLGAIVLECTNMCPYARAIRAATGLPVFSMVDLVTWFHSGLRPRSYLSTSDRTVI